MDPLYFSCADCKVVVDAGKRWAYAYLVMSGVVALGGDASPPAVLAMKEYWFPPIEDDLAVAMRPSTTGAFVS
jgi:hypothetical protein